MNQIFGYDPKYEGFDLRYPSPPRVHWLALLLGWIAIAWCIDHYVPANWHDVAHSLVVDAWAFYLCNWIRLLDTDAKSPLWCDIYVAAELVCVGLGTIPNPSRAVVILAVVLAVASWILGIATVFILRADLERHYNDREHAGLVLNGLMTFFFSFIYFQYHLYDIAQRRKRVAEAMGANAYGSQIS